MKRPPILLWLALAAVPALAADRYSIDPRHTYPYFEVSHMGFSTQRGRFNGATGKIVLDAVAQTGHIEVTIDTATIDMGLDDWDKHMRGPDFFNVAAYPTMTYSADRITFDGDRPVAAEGTLTLLGASRPVALSIADFRCGFHLLILKTVCGAEVSAKLRRSEFGMNKYLPMVGDDIHIIIPVEAIRE